MGKVLASQQLSHSEALAKLLRFVVEETLRGRGDQLKETRLGLEVFGRSAANYDCASDPIVRVQMGRLRHRLQEYYGHTADRLIIEIPRGRYTPRFTLRGGAPTAGLRSAAGEAADGAERLAVLPFVNMSSAPDSENFSDGLTEELINVLARDSRLHVVARTSTFQFKREARDVRAIGRELDVDKILEGSVRRAGARVRITAQLVNVADGCHVWSDRYERKLTDVFAIYDDIASAIYRALRTQLAANKTPLVAFRRRTTAPDARNEYLRGRHGWNNRTADGLPGVVPARPRDFTG